MQWVRAGCSYAPIGVLWPWALLGPLADEVYTVLDAEREWRGPMLWEDDERWPGARKCQYSKRLATRGVVWWYDVMSETGSGEWCTWHEARERYELQGVMDERAWARLLGELRAQSDEVQEAWRAQTGRGDVGRRDGEPMGGGATWRATVRASKWQWEAVVAARKTAPCLDGG